MPLEADSTEINIMKGYGHHNTSLLFSGLGKDWLIFSERFKCVLGVYSLDLLHTDARDDAKYKARILCTLLSAPKWDCGTVLEDTF